MSQGGSAIRGYIGINDDRDEDAAGEDFDESPSLARGEPIEEAISNLLGAIIMDRAGWHRVNALAVPSNLTLAFSPPSSPELNVPELNVIERVWLHLKERSLPHRV